MKKIMSRLMASFLISMCALLGLLFSFPVPAKASEVNGPPALLSSEEIRAELDAISSRYSVGDYLSEEDEAFVRQYAVPTAATRAGINSGPVDIRGTMYGVSVSALGTVYFESTSVLGKAYGANVNVVVNSGSTPQKMTFTVHCTAFGAGMDGGLFIVHNGTAPATAYNTRAFSASPRNPFSGVVLFADITTTLSVTTASGSYFTLESA